MSDEEPLISVSYGLVRAGCAGPDSQELRLLGAWAPSSVAEDECPAAGTIPSFTCPGWPPAHPFRSRSTSSWETSHWDTLPQAQALKLRHANGAQGTLRLEGKDKPVEVGM